MAAVTYTGTRNLAGDVLGPNLVSNGHFTDGTTGWTAVGNATIAKTADNRLHVEATGASGYATASITTESGSLYCVDVDAEQATGKNCFVLIVESGTVASKTIPTGSDGAFTFYYVAGATSASIRLSHSSSASSGEDLYCDNVKLRKVLVRGHSTDIEHLTNVDFGLDHNWTKGTGCTITGGAASWDGTQVTNSDLAYISTSFSALRRGKVYDTSLQVTARTAGTVAWLLGSGTNLAASGTARSTVATFTEQLTVPAATTLPIVRLRANLDFVGSIDNVSVKLAANNNWTLDLSIQKNTYQQERRPSFDRVYSLDKSAAVTTYDGAETFHSFTTMIQDYQTYPFIDEWLASVEDGTSFTFDLFGTSTQPDNPVSMILESYSRQPAMTVAGSRAYRYQVTLREA